LLEVWLPKSKIKTSIDSEVSFQDVRKVHPALRNYLGYCLHKVTTILKTETNMALAKHGIQGPHFAILSVIATSQSEMNHVKLCEETGIDKASMVKIIDHLEKLEFIERVGSRKDRRIKNLVLTKKGFIRLQKCKTVRSVIENQLLSSLNSSDIATFKNLLLRILDQQKSS
jgi:DNA-binding MarR family transcriptional regulator